MPDQARLQLGRNPPTRVVADRDITAGEHLYAAEFSVKGKQDDPSMPGFAGTRNLYIADEQVGNGEIVTQPGVFCLVGDGICVGRDSGSPFTPDYQSPFRSPGAAIDKVIVDVSETPTSTTKHRSEPG